MSRERKNDDDGVVAISSKWDFLKKGFPEFLRDPIQTVLDFLRGLPFLNEERKGEFINRVKAERDNDNKDKP